MDPSSKPNNISGPRGIEKITIDSKIISNKHVELISKWIDKIDTSEESPTLYEFKLILRGTCDGFTPKKFHEICDNQPRTVSIIKVKESNEILGGYNPIEWKSYDSEDVNSFGITKDSFIFSFKDKKNVDDYILSRVKNEKRAIKNWVGHGPSFGLIDFNVPKNGSSLSVCCTKRDYEKLIKEKGGVSARLPIEEYEVFKL